MAAPASVPPPSQSARPEGPVTWPWWAGLAGLGLAVVAAALLGSIVLIVVAALGYGSTGNPSAGANLVGVIVQDVAFVAMPIVLIASRTEGTVRPWMLGLRRPPVKAAILWMVVAYAGLLVFGLVWGLFVHYKEESSVADDLPLLGGALVADVFAPIAEETLFRGFIFPTLRNKVGLIGGIVLTGFLFGAIHYGSAPDGALVPLAVFGALLCVVYYMTKSLLPCMLIHCINNCVAYGAQVHWDWQIAASLALAVPAVLGLYVLVTRRFSAPGPQPVPV